MVLKRCPPAGKKHGITELHPDVVSYVSHATQQRLQNLVEKISETAQQKNFSYKVTRCCPEETELAVDSGSVLPGLREGAGPGPGRRTWSPGAPAGATAAPPAPR